MSVGLIINFFFRSALELGRQLREELMLSVCEVPGVTLGTQNDKIKSSALGYNN